MLSEKLYPLCDTERVAGKESVPLLQDEGGPDECQGSADERGARYAYPQAAAERPAGPHPRRVLVLLLDGSGLYGCGSPAQGAYHDRRGRDAVDPQAEGEDICAEPDSAATASDRAVAEIRAG